MRVFISGATGFVGANLVRYFAALGHEVIASGRSRHPPLLKKYAAYVQWDVAAGPIPIKAEMAVHVAGLASDGAKWEDYVAANIAGTRHFMQTAAGCAKVVVISSSSVYRYEQGIARESDLIEPERLPLYGKSKYGAEKEVAALYTAGQQVLILRPRAIYGVGDRVLLPKLLKLEKSGLLISPVKKGVKTSLTHISNIQEAIRLFLQTELPAEIHCLNIADEPVYQLETVLNELFYVYYGRKLPVLSISPLLLQPIVLINKRFGFNKTLTPMMWNIITKDSVMDISKAKALLHYKPLTDFKTSVPEVADWVRRFGSKSVFLKSLDDAPWSHIES